MTAHKLNRLIKPGAPRSVHLFAAPLFWSLVGGLLILRGWPWLGTGNGRWLFLVAVFLGTVKSLLILDHVARKTMQRIALFKDGTCLGAVFSWKSWLLVGVMIAAGSLLRSLGQPGQFLGVLYCAVGWSLCFSSRLGWVLWTALRK
jgi:hypothetical protein